MWKVSILAIFYVKVTYLGIRSAHERVWLVEKKPIWLPRAYLTRRDLEPARSNVHVCKLVRELTKIQIRTVTAEKVPVFLVLNYAFCHVYLNFYSVHKTWLDYVFFFFFFFFFLFGGLKIHVASAQQNIALVVLLKWSACSLWKLMGYLVMLKNSNQ